MALDYVARCKECGRIVCWHSSNLEGRDPKYLAKSLADDIRCGLSLERMETEEARNTPFGHSDECSHARPRKKKRTMPLFKE